MALFLVGEVAALQERAHLGVAELVLRGHMQAQVRIGVRGQLEIGVVALLEDVQVVQVRAVAAPFHPQSHADAGRRHQGHIVVAGNVDRQRHRVGEEGERGAAAVELGQGHAAREVDAVQLRVRLAVAPHR